MSRSASIDQNKAPSSQRLRQALAAMAEDDTKLTVSALSEKAGISRNALYRYHPEALHQLHKLQRQRHRDSSQDKCMLGKLRSDNDALKLKVAGLVALVDHYFSAWQEASTLLKRRESELAGLRKINNSKVVSIGK